MRKEGGGGEERKGLAWWGAGREGQEPLALVHLVLLHLAEWCTEGPLSDHKGNTWGLWAGRGKGLEGGRGWKTGDLSCRWG